MASKMALRHEVRDNRLVEYRPVAVEQLTDPFHPFDLRLRYHHVSEPQARKKDLAKAAHVHDPASLVETF
jgi:hypothetical protein